MEIFAKIKNVFKGKRFFVIILLFFIASGIILPQTTNAGFWDVIGSAGSITANAFTAAAMVLPLAATAILSGIVVTLLNWTILLATTGVSYTASPAVNIGWPVVRDFANMFVVLGFVVIGLATILRFKNYEAQKLLLPLIVATILINFSLVICGVFIDVSNIVMAYFFMGAGQGIGDKAGAIIKTSLDMAAMMKDENPIAFAMRISSYIFFNLTTVLILTLYIFMLIFRIMALWILVILSPLAFISYVFPASKKFYEMWKNNFIQWCIIGAPAGLFYFIAAKMIEKGSGIPNPPAFNRSAIFAGQFGTASQSFFQSLTGMFSLFIPGIFLIIGFLFALKTSAMGADIITSRAGKAWSGLKNYASQATKTGAKYAGGKIAGATGVAGLYNRTRDKITQGMEGSVLPTGYTSKRKQKTVSAYDHGDATDEQLLQSYKQSQSRFASEADKDKGAAAVIEMQKRKKLNLLPQEEREKAVAHAIARGGHATEKAFTESHPYLVTGVTDQDAVNSLKEKEVKRQKDEWLASHGGMMSSAEAKNIENWVDKNYTPDGSVVQSIKANMIKDKTAQKKIGYKETTENEARTAMLTEKEKEIRENDKTKTDVQVKADLATYESTITDADINTRVADMTKIRTQEKSLEYESASYEDARQELINEKIKKLQAAGKSGPELDRLTKLFSDNITFDRVQTQQTSSTKDRKIKAIKKLGYSKIQEFSKEGIDEDVLSYADAGAFKSAYSRLNAEQTDAYKDMRSKSKAEMLRIINSSPDAASIGLSADPGVTEVENAIDYLKRSTNSINKDLAKKAENILKNLVTTYS